MQLNLPTKHLVYQVYKATSIDGAKAKALARFGKGVAIEWIDDKTPLTSKHSTFFLLKKNMNFLVTLEAMGIQSYAILQQFNKQKNTSKQNVRKSLVSVHLPLEILEFPTLLKLSDTDHPKLPNYGMGSTGRSSDRSRGRNDALTSCRDLQLEGSPELAVSDFRHKSFHCVNQACATNKTGLALLGSFRTHKWAGKKHATCFFSIYFLFPFVSIVRPTKDGSLFRARN